MAIASILCSVFSAITLIFVNNQHLISETALNTLHYIFYVCGTYIGYSFFIYAVNPPYSAWAVGTVNVTRCNIAPITPVLLCGG